ncbi:MAG TPA: type IV pilus modification protein PilV [Wenzhouxiangella sp.]|nr:type IV pilus modification protein PilV [Wenzhouxiangella sp.]
MKSSKIKFSPRSQRGMSLIEVLVALLVLSIGLLGLAALQSFTLQANQGAYHRTQAVNTAYEVADFLRANRGNPGAIDFSVWNTRISQQLPAGALAVNWLDPFAQITVTWQDERSDDTPGGGETVTITVNL